MRAKPDPLDIPEARRRALGWLARREYGQRELIDKLIRRGCSESVAIRVAEGLEADGLLSDHRFVDALVHRRQERGYGPVYIRRELETKGIAPELISQSLSVRDPNWLSGLRRVVKKKYGDRISSDRMQRVKQTRFLVSRGFTHDQIRTVLGSSSGDD